MFAQTAITVLLLLCYSFPSTLIYGFLLGAIDTLHYSEYAACLSKNRTISHRHQAWFCWRHAIFYVRRLEFPSEISQRSLVFLCFYVVSLFDFVQITNSRKNLPKRGNRLKGNFSCWKTEYCSRLADRKEEAALSMSVRRQRKPRRPNMAKTPQRFDRQLNEARTPRQDLHSIQIIPANDQQNQPWLRNQVNMTNLRLIDVNLTGLIAVALECDGGFAYQYQPTLVWWLFKHAFLANTAKLFRQLAGDQQILILVCLHPSGNITLFEWWRFLHASNFPCNFLHQQNSLLL